MFFIVFQIWLTLDDDEKIDMFKEQLMSWTSDSEMRKEAMKALIKCLNPAEKNFVHGVAKPRGPYR